MTTASRIICSYTFIVMTYISRCPSFPQSCEHFPDDFETIPGIVNGFAFLWAHCAVNFENLSYVFKRKTTKAKNASHHTSDNTSVCVSIATFLNHGPNNTLIQLRT